MLLNVAYNNLYKVLARKFIEKKIFDYQAEIRKERPVVFIEIHL